MDKLGKIIKANLSDKSDLPGWYDKRLEACSKCPLNSINYTPEVIPEKLRYAKYSALNRGKAFCWECGCGIEAKASLPESECGGKPQRWSSIKEGESELSSEDVEFDLENLSPDKANVSFRRGYIYVDYGEIDEGADTSVSLLVKPKTEEDFINLKVATECGCTSMDPVVIGRNIELNVEYDSTRLGFFKKLVTIDYTSKRRNQIRMRVTGTVNKLEQHYEI